MVNNKKHLFLRIVRRVYRNSAYCISLPVTFCIFLLQPFIKVRFIALFSDRIGHYALNTELMLCALENCKTKDSAIKRFYYTAEAPICNEQLHIMWKRTIPIIPFTLIASQIDYLLTKIIGHSYKNDTAKQFHHAVAYQDSHGYLEQYTPRLSFTPSEKQRGKELLQKLGIAKNARIVCLVARDSQFLKDYFPEKDWSYHDYRDANIAHYKKAALFLAEQGFYVIRMGKSVATKFNIAHPLIIDYANHELRSDFLDIFLPSRCEFFISTSTGLDAIPQLFRRPLILTNIAPINGQIQYWFPCVLFITKKIKDIKTGKFLTFQEIESLVANHKNLVQEITKLNIELLENSEDEITELIKEMVLRLCNKWQDTQKSLWLQRELKNHFPKTLIYDQLHFSPSMLRIKMGSHFLNQYFNLINSNYSNGYFLHIKDEILHDN